MKTPIILSLYALTFFGFVLTRCGAAPDTTSTLPFYRSADLTPEWISEQDVSYESIHRIRDFTFQNQDGDTVSSTDFDGRIYVANFFFVHCTGICPSLRSNMAMVQKAYKDDPEVLLISHSVTPDLDTVPVLKNYATVNHVISGKWHLVTGDRSDIYDLARHSYFAEFDAGSAEDFLHSENFVLIDRERRIRGVYNGTLPLDVKRLIEDIALLKAEYAIADA